MLDHEMSIEVLNGTVSAAAWADAHGDALVEAALTGGALYWELHHFRWRSVLELVFADEAAWDRFRRSTAVRAALDAVPDPVGGLLIYRGRGGGAGAGAPRRLRPTAGSDAAALPVPRDAPVMATDARDLPRYLTPI